jgi:hypothetical protein
MNCACSDVVRKTKIRLSFLVAAPYLLAAHLWPALGTQQYAQYFWNEFLRINYHLQLQYRPTDYADQCDTSFLGWDFCTMFPGEIL